MVKKRKTAIIEPVKRKKFYSLFIEDLGKNETSISQNSYQMIYSQKP